MAITSSPLKLNRSSNPNLILELSLRGCLLCIVFSLLIACGSSPERHPRVRQPIDINDIVNLQSVESTCISSAGNFFAEDRLTKALEGKAIMAIIELDRISADIGIDPKPLVATFSRKIPVGDSYLRTVIWIYKIDPDRAAELEVGSTYQVLARVQTSSFLTRNCEIDYDYRHNEYIYLHIMLESNDSVIRKVEK